MGPAGRMPHGNMKQRCNIEFLMKEDPSASLSSIAKRVGCSWKAVKTVKTKLSSSSPLNDLPRSGRKRKIDEALSNSIMNLVHNERITSSQEIVSALQKDSSIGQSVCMSARTVRNHLGDHGMRYGHARKGLDLDDFKKRKRKAFAQKHLDKNTDWTRVMFTDSKIFCLQKLGSRIWYKKGSQPVEKVPKFGTKAHVYYGVTVNGPTKPIFVTCGKSRPSPYKKAGSSEAMRGVGKDEYLSHVLPHLQLEGDRLFGEKLKDKWIWQQDGATAHTACDTKNYLNAGMPGRWIEDWPACSADLSWIEQTWAWAEKQLDKVRPQIRTSEEFQQAITQVLLSLPLEHCRNYVRSMPGRLKKVLESNGEMI